MTFEKGNAPWNLGMKMTLEQRKARSGVNNPMFGKTVSDETKNKMRKKMLGRKMSEETKHKLSIAHTGKKLSKIHKQRISMNHADVSGTNHPNYGKPRSEETKNKISQNRQDTFGKNNPMYGRTGENSPHYGKHHSEETKLKMSVAQKNRVVTNTSRRRQSATMQGISYDEWESYAKDKPYCPKFNESCRESNREKYNRSCFICGKPEDKNITKTGKPRKLSIHHVDMNKNQGCDGHEWKLIPVCMKCHGGSHNAKIKSYIEYILSCEV